jgi:hypothetical protein
MGSGYDDGVRCLLSSTVYSNGFVEGFSAEEAYVILSATTQVAKPVQRGAMPRIAFGSA